MSAYFVDQVLAAARKTEADNERGAALKAKLADELERYHRNACYPEAIEIETAIAVSNIIEILMEFGRASGPVICPECKGERRVGGFLCTRCNGDAQIPANKLRPGERGAFQ